MQLTGAVPVPSHLQLPSFIGYSPNFDQIWSLILRAQVIIFPRLSLGIHQRLRLVQPFSFGQCLGRTLSRPENGEKPIGKHHLLYPPGDTCFPIFLLEPLLELGLHPFSDKAMFKKTSAVWVISLESRVLSTGYRCFLPSNFTSFPVVFPWQARLARGCADLRKLC